MLLVLTTLILSAQVAVGHVYSTGDVLYAEVSSLTSTDTFIPLSYYTLPYCRPPGGVEKIETSLGEAVMGDRMLNSPYRFRTFLNESVFVCTTHPLTNHDVDLLKKMIRDRYQVNIFLDKLPALWYDNLVGVISGQTGFPIGYYYGSSTGEDVFHIMNHLKFRVSVHEHEIVGFEVNSCSILSDPKMSENATMYSNHGFFLVDCLSQVEVAQVIEVGERVSFTYEVEFVKSDTKWSSRWDPYLKNKGDSDILLLSIVNSAITDLFLLGGLAWIYIRNKRQHSKGYQYQTLDPLNNDILNSGNEALDWPKLGRLLSVMVGVGVQIMGMAIITVTFAALGFVSPASRGSLLIGIVSFYVCLGFLGGFVGVYVQKAVNGTSEGWKSTSWFIASGFPGLAFAVHFMLNLMLWSQNSTGAISIIVYLGVFLMWLGILVPLTLLGGYLGAKTDQIEGLSQVDWVPRKAGASKLLVWFLALGAGTIPFGVVVLQLFSILSSLYFGTYYYSYGFLLIALLLFVISCIMVSMIVTYMSLRAEEESGWRWKSFWASGSAGIYFLVYCIRYFIYDLHGLSSIYSVIVYLGYAVIATISTILAAGSAGFLGCFYLVKLLSSSNKSTAALGV